MQADWLPDDIDIIPLQVWDPNDTKVDPQALPMVLFILALRKRVQTLLSPMLKLTQILSAGLVIYYLDVF